MNESLERKILEGELRALNRSGFDLNLTDKEIADLSLDDLRAVVRSLQFVMRSMGGSRVGSLGSF